MSKSKTLICPLLANDVIVVAAMNAKTDSFPKVTTIIPAISREANDDATIVTGTREKRRILEAYETKFGTGYPDSIITRKKGKLVDSTLLSNSTRRMRPSKDKFYRVDILELHSVIATIIKEWVGICLNSKLGSPHSGMGFIPIWGPTYAQRNHILCIFG